MIAFLTGKLAGRSTTAAFIDVGGVGYAVSMSQASLAKLPEAGAEVHVLTYLQVREDALALFGFLSAEEKALFERLISVSGVGPKVALAALSSFSPRALADAIAAQDVALVSRIPGVGKKTASRIILEAERLARPGHRRPVRRNGDRSAYGRGAERRHGGAAFHGLHVRGSRCCAQGRPGGRGRRRPATIRVEASGFRRPAGLSGARPRAERDV